MLESVKQLYECNQSPIFLFGSDYRLIWHNPAAEQLTRLNKIEVLYDLCILSNYDEKQEDLSNGKPCYVLGNSLFGINSVLLQPITSEQSSNILAIVLEQSDRWQLPVTENGFSSVLAQYRDPIFSIYNMLGPIKKSLEENEAYDSCDYIDRIGRMCYRTIRATTNLSNYFKYHSDDFSCHLKTTSLNHFIEDLCFEARKFIGHTEIGFACKICDDVVISDVDTDVMSIAIYNLIANSCLYTAPGNEITVQLDCAENEYLITVSDKGVGMSEDVQSHVFDPFYSYDPNGSPALGVGLGLTIVKRIAQLHQGNCILTSTPNEGTTVILRLPIISNQSDSKVEASTVDPVGRFSPPYIYLVDICNTKTVDII